MRDARRIDQPEPVVEEELQADRQERDAPHHRVAEAGAEGDHQDPDAHLATRSGPCVLREEEVGPAKTPRR
jgi:hypothetical protein